MAQTAVLYRMVMEDHLCPFGRKFKDLLERRGFEVEDHKLTTREQTDTFMEEHGVETTPQTFIEGERIGGYDDLREHFGEEVKAEGETTYRPVLAIFAVGFLTALAISYPAFGTVFTLRAAEWFIAVSMVLLALQKLQDVGKRPISHAAFGFAAFLGDHTQGKSSSILLIG